MDRSSSERTGWKGKQVALYVGAAERHKALPSDGWWVYRLGLVVRETWVHWLWSLQGIWVTLVLSGGPTQQVTSNPLPDAKVCYQWHNVTTGVPLWLKLGQILFNICSADLDEESEASKASQVIKDSEEWQYQDVLKDVLPFKGSSTESNLKLNKWKWRVLHLILSTPSWTYEKQLCREKTWGSWRTTRWPWASSMPFSKDGQCYPGIQVCLGKSNVSRQKKMILPLHSLWVLHNWSAGFDSGLPSRKQTRTYCSKSTEGKDD